MSVLIRLELSGPGVQYMADNQLYNSIVTAHAILMIFFMVKEKQINISVTRVKNFHSLVKIGNFLTNQNILNPWWISGFIDAEGSFMLTFWENSKVKLGWTAQPSFSIRLHKKDKSILEAIRDTIGIGSIHDGSEDAVVYKISSIKDLEVLINYLNKYPLITQKQADFI